jgi:hypothetical protein
MAHLLQLSVALSGTAAPVTGLPLSVRYIRIHNPSTSNAIAYTINGSTPTINGNGVTVGGSAPATDVIDLTMSQSKLDTSGLTMVGATTQTATILYSV